MPTVIAQFKLEGEELFPRHTTTDEIKEAVVRRLRTRSATFDKLVEAPVDSSSEQLNDSTVNEGEIEEVEHVQATLVDIPLSVDGDALKILESDPDMVYVKAISELESGSLECEAIADEDVSHISFTRRS